MIAGAEVADIRIGFDMVPDVVMVTVTWFELYLCPTTAGADACTGAGRAGSGVTAGKGATGAATASTSAKACGAGVMGTTVTADGSTDIGS